MIIKGQDLSILDIYLDKLEDIEQGKQSLNEVRDELGNYLNDKYVKGKPKYFK
jgi:hypothetical protein